MAKGKPQKKHTDLEKTEIVERICSNYVDGNTIESCCDNEGIASKTFYIWINENSQLTDIYQAARNQLDRNFKDNLRKRALSSLEKLVTGFDYDEIQIEEKLVDTGKKDDNGKPVQKLKVVKQIKTKKIVPPNTTAVMFALNNTNKFEDEKFVHATKTELTGKDGQQLASIVNVVLERPNQQPIESEAEVRKQNGLE